MTALTKYPILTGGFSKFLNPDRFSSKYQKFINILVNKCNYAICRFKFSTIVQQKILNQSKLPHLQYLRGQQIWWCEAAMYSNPLVMHTIFCSLYLDFRNFWCLPYPNNALNFYSNSASKTVFSFCSSEYCFYDSKSIKIYNLAILYP